MLTITLNQLAAALLGAGAYIYQCAGYWKACAIVCGTRIERNSPDPYAALAAVAATLIECEAWPAGQDAHDTPTARAAYREGWARSAAQPVAARFTAAEAAAAATSDEEEAVFDKVKRDDCLLPPEWPAARRLVAAGRIRPYWAPPHDDINTFYVPDSII